MPKSKAQKKKIVSDFEDKLDRVKTAVFVNFAGLPVKEINQLRSQCRAAGIDYVVAKKTLLKKVLSAKNYQATDKELNGEIAAIFSYEDEVAAPKLIKAFIKDHDKMKITAGILDGGLIDQGKVLALAALPSKLELLAKLVGSIASPLSGLVNVLQGNLRGLVCVLNAVREQKS